MTNPQTMVERVADVLSPPYFGQLPEDRVRAVNRARAAIEAMREPRDGMVVCGLDSRGNDITWSAAVDIWQSMIDAALSE